MLGDFVKRVEYDSLRCRQCCKFEKEDDPWVPILTEEEMAKINRKVADGRGCFKRYKNSSTVFQVRPVKSSKNPKIYVCPFLDEPSHICNIYAIRPLDCRLWPFIFMKHKNGKGLFLGCWHKRFCPSLSRMSDEERTALKARTVAWVEKRGLVQLVKKMPEMILDYDEDATIVKELA